MYLPPEDASSLLHVSDFKFAIRIVGIREHGNPDTSRHQFAK